MNLLDVLLAVVFQPVVLLELLLLFDVFVCLPVVVLLPRHRVLCGADTCCIPVGSNICVSSVLGVWKFVRCVAFGHICMSAHTVL